MQTHTHTHTQRNIRMHTHACKHTHKPNNMSETRLQCESWKVRLYTQNAFQSPPPPPPFLNSIFYCFLKEIWILKSGCSLRSPIHATTTKTNWGSPSISLSTGPDAVIHPLQTLTKRARQQRVYPGLRLAVVKQILSAATAAPLGRGESRRTRNQCGEVWGTSVQLAVNQYMT